MMSLQQIGVQVLECIVEHIRLPALHITRDGVEVCEIVQHDILRKRISERTRKHGVDRIVHQVVEDTFQELDIHPGAHPRSHRKKDS